MSTTPVRKQKEEQVREVAGLNERFEKYILHRRHEDAGFDEESEFKVKLGHQKRTHDKEEEEVKNSHEVVKLGLLNQINASNMDSQSLSAELDRVNRDCENLLAQHVFLESKINAQMKQLKDSQDERLELANKVESVEQELLALQRESELNANRMAVLKQFMQSLEEQHNNHLDELSAENMLRDDSYRKIADSDMKSAVYDEPNLNLLPSLHEEEVKKRNDLLQDMRLNLEERNNDSLESSKSVFEAQLSGYRTQLEEMNNNLNVLNQRIKSNTPTTLAADLKSEINLLKNELETLRLQRSNLIADKNQHIAYVKDQIKDKIVEMDALQEVKMTLGFELQVLGRALLIEEKRVGVSSLPNSSYDVANKKRKHDTPGPASNATPSTTQSAPGLERRTSARMKRTA